MAKAPRIPSGVSICKASNGRQVFFRCRIGKKVTGGVPRIQSFQTKAEAVEWRDEQLVQFRKTGQDTSELTAKQMAEAKDCYRLLEAKGNPLSLVSAVKYALKFAVPDKGILAWEDAVGKWLNDPRRAKPLGVGTANAYRNTVRMFFTEHPSLKPHQVREDDVLEWLDDDEWEIATQAHHLNNLKVFFRWMVANGYAGGDPCSAIEKRSFESAGNIRILTPSETRKLLEVCPTEMLAAVSICLFAGLRTSEVRCLTWDEIGDAEFEVAKSKTKTQRHRFIVMSETLKAWLASAAHPRSGLVAPEDWREQFDALTAAAGWREKVKVDGVDKVISTWPRNAMRHSFGSYWFAQNRDVNHLSAIMGSSVSMIERHYKHVLPTQVAIEYFAILPEKQ